MAWDTIGSNARCAAPRAIFPRAAVVLTAVWRGVSGASGGGGIGSLAAAAASDVLRAALGGTIVDKP